MDPFGKVLHAPPPPRPEPQPKDHETAGAGRAEWESANTAPGDGVTADLNARLIRWSPDDHNPNRSGRARAGPRQWT